MVTALVAQDMEQDPSLRFGAYGEQVLGVLNQGNRPVRTLPGQIAVILAFKHLQRLISRKQGSLLHLFMKL